MHALVRISLLAGTALVTVGGAASAQTIDGIIVVGADKRPVATTKVALLDRRQNVLDTITTDVFGGFTFTAKKPGKYMLLVRRKGYYPVLTDDFDLLKDETRRDTIYITGKAAETSVRDAIAHDVRRVFNSVSGAGMQRFLGPDDIEEMRSRAFSLGDLIRDGRLAGLQWYNPPSGCLRFSGSSGCAQIFLDGLPVFVRVDAISASDIEAIVALRDMELGVAATTRGNMDNSRYGAVLVYTRRFTVR
ncbi:MAG: carboxypeptidase regulatory-like domain-containing protein [Gemmatimonadaceae bacterium]|nr:carboxypeptidase regulatory-like domain-containing protein [Gemmatimonadaceae bacterium]